MLDLALSLREDHAEAPALLDAAQVKLGFHDALCATLQRRMEAETDDEVRVELARRLGTLLEDVLGRATDAESVWQGLLEISPSDEVALKRLSKVYAEQEGHASDLAGLLERRVDAASTPEERRELRMQLASVQREALKDRDAEIDVLRSLLEEIPDDDDAMAALARAFVAEERWNEAADVIRDRAMAAPNEERRAALLLEVARAFAGPIEDLFGAVQEYQEVLNTVPGQEGAISDLLTLSAREDISSEVEAVLAPQLEQMGRYEALAVLMQHRIAHVDDMEDRIQRVDALVELCMERLGNPQGALEANEQILEHADGEALEKALERGQRLAGQVEAIEGYAARCAARSTQEEREGSTRAAHARVAATIYEDLVGRPEEAGRILNDLLSAGVGDALACERLERLGRAQANATWEVTALEELVRAPEFEDVAGGMVRLGDARARAGQPLEALTAFREALDEDSGISGAVAGMRAVAETMTAEEVPEEALESLGQSYMATEDIDGMLFVHGIRLAQAKEDPGAALVAAQEIARLHDRRAPSASEALEAWGIVASLDADHGEAIDRIAQLATDAEMAPRGAGLLVEAIATAREEERIFGRAAIAAATVLIESIRDAEGAMAVLGQLFDEVPGHVRGLGLALEAARLGGDAAAVHRALLALAEVTDEPAAATQLLREAAELAEGPLADPVAAIDALKLALSMDDSESSLAQKLMGLLSAQERHEELAELLRERVTVAAEPDERRQLRYGLANLLASRLDALDEAVDVYGDMISENFEDVEAIQEQEVLLRRLERWMDVRDLLERKQETVEPEARAAILLEMARLCADRLDAPEDAVEIYQRIVLEHPLMEEARGPLERLLTAAERWEDLVASYEVRLEAAVAAGDIDGRARHIYRLSSVLATRLGEVDRAQELLKELLDERPDDVHGILALADVYEARGDGGAMRLMLQRADLPQAEGAALEPRLASLSDDPEVQRVHLEQALGLDPATQAAARPRPQPKSQAGARGGLRSRRAGRRTSRAPHLTWSGRTSSFQLGDMEGALRVLSVVYEEVSTDIDVNARIGDLLLRVGQLDEAAGMYRWLVEAESNRNARSKSLALYLTRLARIYLAQELREEAMSLLDRAYGMDTTNVELLMVLGQLHEQSQSWEDALKIYRAMLLQNADRTGLLRRGDIYLHLSNIHVGLNEMPKAQAMLRRGLQEDPEHPELAARLQQLGA